MACTQAGQKNFCGLGGGGTILCLRSVILQIYPAAVLEKGKDRERRDTGETDSQMFFEKV